MHAVLIFVNVNLVFITAAFCDSCVYMCMVCGRDAQLHMLTFAFADGFCAASVRVLCMPVYRVYYVDIVDIDKLRWVYLSIALIRRLNGCEKESTRCDSFERIASSAGNGCGK